jgi:hypothetical protein
VDTDGIAVVRIQNEGGEVVGEFRYDFSGLQPNGLLTVEETWDIPGSTPGSYAIQAYVLYDSRSSETKRMIVPICKDLSGLAAGFGAISGRRHYDVLADLDTDGDVDGSDVALWMTYWDQAHCP